MSGRSASGRAAIGRVALAAVCALAGAGIAAPAAARAATPGVCAAADADIYRPPDGAPAAPGDVIACREVGSLPMVVTSTPYRAWKLRYGSTDGRGRPAVVAGTVIEPLTPWTGPGKRPVVAFVPGTLGIGPQCAFSKQLAGEYQDAYEGANLAALLDAGYAVAVTDGAGYLDGQVHPYVVGADAGHAVLDIVRAAPDLPGGGVGAGAPVGIWGYSEGGAGSLWAGQLAASYAPELDVVGVAAGAAPADLKQVAANLDGGMFAGFLVDAVIGLASTHPGLPFDELLNDRGREAVRDAESLCAVGTVTRFAGARFTDYTKDRLTLDQIYALKAPDGTTWSEVADANRLGVGVGRPGSGARHEIGFPVLQYRGLLDEVIPAETARANRQAYCAAGIPTEWTAYAADHLLGDSLAVRDTVTWLTDRFEGRTATNDC
ncbi:lipase family protein [Streptomyces phaeofaciens JCM 4814]|uniref:Lipase n=1 Tax=Streptomyces phaeofaciens TaxID=68254 RepID=A0A918HM18_9ACTN|nr:lipase family protein [Streptomyces phaeofaciens]GGT80768.1 lipase [Streptomyces phaeofaciens]